MRTISGTGRQEETKTDSRIKESTGTKLVWLDALIGSPVPTLSRTTTPSTTSGQKDGETSPNEENFRPNPAPVEQPKEVRTLIILGKKRISASLAQW